MPRSRLAWPAILSLLVGGQAVATVMARMDLASLVASADRIVVARVERQSAAWTEDGGAIITRVTLQIEEVAKGRLKTGDRVQILREGGEVNGIGMLVEGAARFTVGEEVLVFLEQRAAGTFTVGMAQGRLRVDTVAGRRLVTRDLDGLTLVEPASRESREARTAGVPRPLDEVLSAIRTLVREDAKVRP